MCLLLVLFRLTNMESIYIHLDEQSRESPGKESRKSFFPPPWTDAQKMSAGFPEKFPELEGSSSGTNSGFSGKTGEKSIGQDGYVFPASFSFSSIPRTQKVSESSFQTERKAPFA